jgi:uncharacterized membrane protein YfcA
VTGELIAITLGLLVGLSLGALGGGGSTLAVPILVFVAGMEAQDATTASLLVVGVASAFGVIGHYRAGNVRLGVGVAFGAAGIVGSRIGTLVNQSIDEQVLLLAFSALIVFVAFRMFRSVNRRRDLGELAPVLDGGGDVGGSSTVTTKERVTQQVGIEWSVASIAKLAAAATGVGLLTGLFGVGGGFAVVPALMLLLKFPTRVAIGTSLVVIVINAAMALAMRAGDLDFDWGVVVPFLITVTVGVIVGSRIATRLDADRLTRAFAIMLFVVAAYTAVSTVLTA